MSNILVWTDNASSLLASAITSSQTTLTVTATQGALFPAPSSGQIFVGTLEDTGGNIEVVWCTGRTGDTMTVVRGQENTSAASFASGSRFEIRCTAGMLQAFLQKNGGDTLAGTTNMTGVLALGSAGSIQGGEFTGAHRSGPGVTAGQITVSAGAAYSGGSILLTASNLSTNIPSGTDLCRTNMIVFWYGSITDIPTGWALCNGSNGTPNLTDQFIVGGGGALPTNGTYAAATGSTTPSGGTVTLAAMSAANLVQHTHGSTIFTTAASGHLVGPTGFTGGANQVSTQAGGGTGQNWLTDTGTGLGTSPTPITGTTTGAAHTHTQSIPYMAMFAIMKL